MKQLPQITEAEYEVMKIVWRKAPVSTNEVTAALTETTLWSPKTIQTLLKRLVQKNVLTYTKESRVFVYTPLVMEADYLKQENTRFLNRFYNGNLSSMLMNFAAGSQISNRELTELTNILLKDQKEKEH